MAAEKKEKLQMEVEWDERAGGYFLQRGETGLFVPAEDAQVVGAFLAAGARGKIGLHVRPEVA